jgi:type IV pilus assembly protein PilV
MVGLQAAALQGNRDARLQSTAVSLARELAEMMRGNKDVALLATNPYVGDFQSNPLAAASPSYCLNVGSLPTACGSSAAIANAQMTEWLARVSSELPSPRVVVCVDPAPYSPDGKPRWGCATGGIGATTVIKLGWTRGSTDRTQTGLKALERADTPSLVFPITAGNSL